MKSGTSVATEREVRVRLPYTPHRWQQRAHESPKRYRGCISGIRGGKTVFGAVEFLRLVIAGPPGVALLTGPDLPTIKLTSLETILRGMGPGHVGQWPPELIASHNRSDKVIGLRDGNRVVYRGADNPDDLRGPAAKCAWADEVTLCKPGTLPILQGRLLDTGGRLIVTGTPKGRSNWFYSDVLTGCDEVEPGRVWSNERWDVIRWSSRDNPALRAQDLEDLGREYSETFRRQELEADWIDLSDSPFDPDALTRCFARPSPHWGTPIVDHPVTVGIDPAGHGRDWRTIGVVCRRCRGVVDWWRGHRGPFRPFYAEAGRLAAQWHPDEVIVDETSMGGEMALEELDGTVRVGSPRSIVRGWVFTQRTKYDLLIALACRLEEGIAIATRAELAPLRAQLRSYAWDDSGLETDDVMALALACQGMPPLDQGPRAEPEAAGLAEEPVYRAVDWKRELGDL